MRKIILFSVILTGTALVSEASSLSIIPAMGTITKKDVKWMKSETGQWAGLNGQWYKLNPKDASVWVSKDGKKWEAAKDGMWQDKDGKWLKIVNKKLVWSKDGKDWAEVPEWKWEGGDGKWYKFDSSWTLWVAQM